MNFLNFGKSNPEAKKLSLREKLGAGIKAAGEGILNKMEAVLGGAKEIALTAKHYHDSIKTVGWGDDDSEETFTSTNEPEDSVEAAPAPVKMDEVETVILPEEKEEKTEDNVVQLNEFIPKGIKELEIVNTVNMSFEDILAHQSGQAYLDALQGKIEGLELSVAKGTEDELIAKFQDTPGKLTREEIVLIPVAAIMAGQKAGMFSTDALQKEIGELSLEITERFELGQSANEMLAVLLANFSLLVNKEEEPVAVEAGTIVQFHEFKAKKAAQQAEKIAK